MFGEKMKKQSKKYIFIIFSILAYSILSAQTKTLVHNDSIKFKFDQKYISVSPLLSPRICLGILKSKKMSDDRFFESIIYLHAFDTFSVFRVYGVAYRCNAFILENRRSGLYLLANGGLDYIQHAGFFGSENSDSKIKSVIFPNLAIGTGYSFEINNDSYLRLELDIGYKWLLTNIYISYVW